MIPAGVVIQGTGVACGVDVAILQPMDATHQRHGGAGLTGVVMVIITACLLSACRTAIDFAAIQDAQTAAEIKTALINDPELGSTTIEVSVVRGVAHLSGSVKTQADAERAGGIARSVRGVRDVRLNLQVVGDSASAITASDAESSRVAEASRDATDDPRLLAVGASLGWSGPRVDALDARVSVGPLVRFGSGRGFGPALALNWFQTTVGGAPVGTESLSRIYVRPIMGGVSYTIASDRLSLSPSIVGGVAFNSLTVPSEGNSDRIAVEVGNSLIWRPGVSVWFDVNRRAAVNLSAGYMMTRLRLTFLENGRLVTHNVPGDTTIVQAGVAYKIF
jgi:hypothetical protein